MAELRKELSNVLEPQKAPVRPRMRGGLVPPKVPDFRQKEAPKKKESPYKFL